MTLKGRHHDRHDDQQEQKDQSEGPKLFPDELIDQLLAQVQNKDAESILGESGLAGQLKKQLAERKDGSREVQKLRHPADHRCVMCL